MTHHSQIDVELLTVKEAAAILSIKEAKFRVLLGNKEIPYYKLGALIRIKKEDVIAYLESNKRQ